MFSKKLKDATIGLISTFIGVSCLNASSIVYAKINNNNDSVKIKVNFMEERRKISKELFGINHRYHKDGYGSFDKETMAMKPEFDRLYKEASFGNIRYPGGTVANLFQWKRAIGPVGERERTIHGDPTKGNEFPYFGVDEAAKYAEENNSELIYVYNLGNGSAEDAADLVEYLNCKVGENPNGGIDWAEIRAKNGRVEPYNVVSFELGNEPFSPTQQYWFGSGSPKEVMNLYTYGGEVSIKNGLFFNGGDVTNKKRDDWTSNAAKSEGVSNIIKYTKYAPIIKGEEFKLKVGNENWTRVDNFENATSEDKVYILEEETGRIVFGDGIKGKIPSKGKKIVTEYKTLRDGYVDYYKAMKAVDPNIKLYGSYETKAFVEKLNKENVKYDGMVIHPYTQLSLFKEENEVHHYYKNMITAEERLNDVKDFEELVKEKDSNRQVVVSEYGIYPDNREVIASQLHGLYISKLLMGFADLDIPYASKHCLVDFPIGDSLGPGRQAVIQAIELSDGNMDFIATPSAKIFTLFNKYTGNIVLNEEIENNKKLTYVQKNGKELSMDAISVMPTKDLEGNLYLMILNLDPENSISIDLNLKNYNLQNNLIETWTVSGESFYDANTIDNKNKVDIVKDNFKVQGDNYINYIVKAHSVTAMKINTNNENQVKEELKNLITEASRLLEKSTEGMKIGQYHKGSKEKLNNKIEFAKNIVNNNETIEEIINTLEELNIAISLFNSLIITEDTGDFNKNNKFDIGDLSLVSKSYGKNIDEYDLNKDGIINEYEINFLNFKILE